MMTTLNWLDPAHGDGKHFDLLEIDNDLAFDETGEPVVVDGRPSIAQDIKHALIESQLLVTLIGQRDWFARREIYQQLELLVEDDLRIKVGSCQVIEHNQKTNSIEAHARTLEYADIGFSLTGSRVIVL